MHYSFKVKSKASGEYLPLITISSHTIRQACLSTWARSDSAGTLHTLPSTDLSPKGSLKVEWAVNPPGKIRAAIPEDAVHNTSFRWARMCAAMAHWVKLLPVPAGASIMKSPPLLFKAASVTTSKMCLVQRSNPPLDAEFLPCAHVGCRFFCFVFFASFFCLLFLILRRMGKNKVCLLHIIQSWL